MGFGVNLNGILTLSACRSGLSIRIWRVFGPFQKPLLVPWSEITAQPSRTFFTKMVKLGLGNPPNGKLKINAVSWSKLVGRPGQWQALPCLQLLNLSEIDRHEVVPRVGGHHRRGCDVLLFRPAIPQRVRRDDNWHTDRVGSVCRLSCSGQPAGAVRKGKLSRPRGSYRPIADAWLPRFQLARAFEMQLVRKRSNRASEMT